MTQSKLHAFYRERGLWTDERLGWLLDSAAHRWGDREFLFMDGQRFSFNALNRWVIAVAQYLVDHGIGPGERIMIQSGNCIEVLLLQFAAWRIGAVSVPVVPIYRIHEMKAIVADAKPTVIAAARTFGSREPYLELEQVVAQSEHRPRLQVLFGDGPGVQGWDRLPPAPASDSVLDQARLPEPAPTEHCSMILFTSGTTSAPKGVLMPSRALLSGLQNWRMNLDLSSDDVAASGAPLAHIGAIYTAVLVPLSCGARSVIMPKWDPDQAIKVIEQERATYVAGATVFLHDLVERYERGESPGYRLRMFSSGGAPTPPSLIERAERLGIKASRSYGMTETCGTVAQASRHLPLERRATTEGRIAFGSEVQIVDDDDRLVPFGEIGRIRIRSPQMMIGYTDPALNATQMNEDGWFYPGDLGALTADGYLTMAGRTKDIINRGGEKFSSQDIEAALAAHSSILNAAVIGLPDERLGELICACVIPREPKNWRGPAEILEHLENYGLARQKFPVKWVVVDEFPRTASGKVQKNQLYTIARAQLAGETAK